MHAVTSYPGMEYNTSVCGKENGEFNREHTNSQNTDAVTQFRKLI